MPGHQSVVKNGISTDSNFFFGSEFQFELNSNTDNKNPKLENIFELSGLEDSYKSSTSTAFH